MRFPEKIELLQVIQWHLQEGLKVLAKLKKVHQRMGVSQQEKMRNSTMMTIFLIHLLTSDTDIAISSLLLPIVIIL
jgi:hypothetical protein